MEKNKLTLLLAAILLLFVLPLRAQDEESEEAPAPETEMSVVMVKKADGSRVTTVMLKAVYEDRQDPIAGAAIVLRAESDTAIHELASAVTEADGSAELVVDADAAHFIPKDADGYYNFEVSYEGDDAFDGYAESIMVKDFVIELTAELVDSVKTIQLNAYGIDAGDSTRPFHEEEIGIFIQGMISRLPIEAVWMEEGYGEIEFPSDLPGDAGGKLTIIAALLEHDEYGNVEVAVDMPWGTGFSHNNEIGRALWADAPWWMIIVLVILISGVWGHYVFAMLQLARVKRLENKKETT